MLSVNAHEDDVWCIDPRGHLTLSVSKDTYERLGPVGKKLPFKVHNDRHGAYIINVCEKRDVELRNFILVIDITLCNTAESTVVQAKRKRVLEDWDKRSAVELGDEAGLWDVLYCSTGEFVFGFSTIFLNFVGLFLLHFRSKGVTRIYTPRRSNV